MKTLTPARQWKVAQLFRCCFTRKELAKEFGVSLTQVDKAIRKYVRPGGRRR